MFGYVVIDKPELRCREFDEYRGFYCGLCKTLGKKHGFLSRLSVSYDLTFLSILLSGLYEPELDGQCERCVVHPCSKHCVIKHDYQEYCADMTVFLTWLKCEDDWKDDKKLGKKIYGSMLAKKAKKIADIYPEKCKKITERMKELSECENREEKDIDKVSGLFGSILEEIFVVKKDNWEGLLRKIGFYLGKYIYVLDAYEDLEQDIKSGHYNPLKFLEAEDNFDLQIKNILTMLIAECCKHYHQLPIVEHEPILDNILYAGVWTGYERVLERKEKK